MGPLVWKVLGPGVVDALETRLAFVTTRYLLAILLLLGALLLLHRWLPNTRQAFARVLPGVCVTTVLWLIGASAFSWYVGHLADYAAFYGSLGGVAITLDVLLHQRHPVHLRRRDQRGLARAHRPRAAPQDGNGEGEDTAG